jgi:pimeloyl-ACP methyl ester carboxylesterase
MLHGYGGTQVQYFKLYPKLLETFKVISIDLPGMG